MRFGEMLDLDEINPAREMKERFLKQYYFALFFYALPYISLLVFIINQLTVHGDMTFWVIFLVTLVPTGIIGLILSIWASIKSWKPQSRRNKYLGVALLLFGLGDIIIGILGLLLFCLAVGCWDNPAKP